MKQVQHVWFVCGFISHKFTLQNFTLKCILSILMVNMSTPTKNGVTEDWHFKMYHLMSDFEPQLSPEQVLSIFPTKTSL